jgi:D-psicose/D-tagatose/L-ribulose 3-epimerase
MRISLCNEVIRELPFEQQCAFARAVGYDGLEIAPFTLSAEPHLLSPLRRAQVPRAATDAGIAITGLHYLMLAPKALSITSPDAAQRIRTVDVMRRLRELAADLGACVLVHGSPAQRRLEPGLEADGRKWAAECFAAVADAGPDPAGSEARHRVSARPSEWTRRHRDCLLTTASTWVANGERLSFLASGANP